MLNKFWFCVFLVCLISCSDNKSISIPDDVLPKDKMAAVMVDLHLLEASINVTGVGPRNGDIDFPGKSIPLDINVLKNNNITKVQFEDSFRFYTNNPQLLSEVYQLVLNDLSKMQAELSKKK